MPTYYVDGAVGNNGNLGTSEGAGNAWATIQYAVTNSSAGDQIYIKASADYTEGVTLTAGTAAAWKTFTGYTSTPGDGGKATVDATGYSYGIDFPGFANSYIRLENIIVENGTSGGTEASATGYVAYDNCEANNNGYDGFGSGPNYATYLNCSADGNTHDGFVVNNPAALAFCASTGNGGDGFFGGSHTALVGCVATSNAGDGISIRVLCAANCTIDGDGDDTDIGINIGEYPSLIINNIVYDCTTGIAGTSGFGGDIVSNNLLYANSTNFSNVENESNNLTTDPPAFTDEAGGNYTLASGSAAKNAGADASGTSSPGMDIGAHQSADAGGGSRVIITG